MELLVNLSWMYIFLFFLWAVREKIGAIATPDYIQNAPGLPKTRSGECVYVYVSVRVSWSKPKVVTPPLFIYVCPLQARSCGASFARSPAMSTTWATCPRWPTRRWWTNSSRTGAARRCDGGRGRSRHSDPAPPHPRPALGAEGNDGAPTMWRSRAEM